MGGVRSGISQHNLRIAGDGQCPGNVRKVGDAHPAQFDVIGGRDRNVGRHLDIVIAPSKGYSARLDDHRVTIWRPSVG